MVVMLKAKWSKLGSQKEVPELKWTDEYGNIFHWPYNDPKHIGDKIFLVVPKDRKDLVSILPFVDGDKADFLRSL